MVLLILAANMRTDMNFNTNNFVFCHWHSKKKNEKNKWWAGTGWLTRKVPLSIRTSFVSNKNLFCLANVETNRL